MSASHLKRPFRDAFCNGREGKIEAPQGLTVTLAKPNRATYQSWLACLDTVRTSKFEEILAIEGLIPQIERRA
jgi:hypothetical protein